MPSLNMGREAFPFTASEVDLHITKHQAGNYALGYVDEHGDFYVQYVGRSDTDVNTRIKDHLSERYTHFKFRYATSPKDAYEWECHNYHDFVRSGLNNKVHPDLPNTSKNWKCPVCG